MENKENKGFRKKWGGANPSTPATAPAPPAGIRPEVAALVESRYSEFLELWYATGHWWDPSSQELLLFLEGEL